MYPDGQRKAVHGQTVRKYFLVTRKTNTDGQTKAVLMLVGVSIVTKKREPGNLVPSRFSGQIRKVEARLGKLAKIRKVKTN